MNKDTPSPKLPFYKSLKFWLYTILVVFLVTRVILDFYSDYFLVVDIPSEFEEVSTENGIGTSIICQIDSIRERVEIYKKRRMAIDKDSESAEKDFPDFNPYSNTKIFNLVSIFNILQMIPFGEMKYVRCSFGNENGLYTNQIEINKKQEDGGYKKIRYRIADKDMNTLLQQSSKSLIKELYPNSYLIYCIDKKLFKDAIEIGKILSKKSIDKSSKENVYPFYANLLYANAMSEQAYSFSVDTAKMENYIADSIQFELAQEAIDDAEKILTSSSIKSDPKAWANFYFYKGFFLLKKQEHRLASDCFEKAINKLNGDSSKSIIPFKALTLNNLAFAHYNIYFYCKKNESLAIAKEEIEKAEEMVLAILNDQNIDDNKLIRSAYRVYETVLETNAEILFLEFAKDKKDINKMKEVRKHLIIAAQFGKPITYEICRDYPLYRQIVTEYRKLCNSDLIMRKELKIDKVEMNKIISVRENRATVHCK